MKNIMLVNDEKHLKAMFAISEIAQEYQKNGETKLRAVAASVDKARSIDPSITLADIIWTVKSTYG